MQLCLFFSLNALLSVPHLAALAVQHLVVIQSAVRDGSTILAFHSTFVNRQGMCCLVFAFLCFGGWFWCLFVGFFFP